MAKSWEPLAGGSDFVCESCGALYAVEVSPLQVRDRTVANCEACGEVMADWNSALGLTFLLKERPRQVARDPAPPVQADESEELGEEQPQHHKDQGD